MNHTVRLHSEIFCIDSAHILQRLKARFENL